MRNAISHTAAGILLLMLPAWIAVAADAGSPKATPDWSTSDTTPQNGSSTTWDTPPREEKPQGGVAAETAPKSKRAQPASGGDGTQTEDELYVGNKARTRDTSGRQVQPGSERRKAADGKPATQEGDTLVPRRKTPPIETSTRPSKVGTMKQISVPAAATREISTKNVEGPGTTITRVTDITITSAMVYWRPVPGAAGYTLHGAAKGLNNPVTAKEIPQPQNLPPEMSVTLSGLTTGVENTVWVSIRYADGRTGMSDVKPVTLLLPRNPSVFYAVPVDARTVRLEWQPTAGAIHYLVEGTNLPRKQLTGTSITVSNLPTTGPRQWALMAAYPPGVYDADHPSIATMEAREAMVERAFKTGQSRWHNGGPDPDRWKRYALDSTMDYDQLVRSYPSIWIVTRAYQHLLDRQATPQEAGTFVNQLNNGTPWQQVWRAVAQSNERYRRYGYWSPAPMESLAQARTTFTKPGMINAQACFGGMGDACDSPEVGEPNWHTAFNLPDGTRMAFVDMNVAVGSILHDNACLQKPAGLHCDNQAWHWVVEHIPLASSAVTDAAMEWNKAFWNWTDRRMWRMRFGPYPVDKNVRRANWYDDLRSAPARPAYMAPVYTAGITTPNQNQRYNGFETLSTHYGLRAPTGTSLDYRDKDYCRSALFSETKSAFGKADWGICK